MSATLEALAAKYGTDKLKHGYIPFYEKMLPKEPKRILEIGVKEGRSLAMWGEYFPDAEVHGLDLFEEHSIWNACETIGLPFDDYKGNKERFIFHKGNQCDWKVLELLRELDFDLIIDDGSHNARDQMMTFFGLFNGKQYFIEDLHCCAEEFYSQGLPFDLRAPGVLGSIYANNAEHSYEETKIEFDKMKANIVCITSNR